MNIKQILHHYLKSMPYHTITIVIQIDMNIVHPQSEYEAKFLSVLQQTLTNTSDAVLRIVQCYLFFKNECNYGTIAQLKSIMETNRCNSGDTIHGMFPPIIPTVVYNWFKFRNIRIGSCDCIVTEHTCDLFKEGHFQNICSSCRNSHIYSSRLVFLAKNNTLVQIPNLFDTHCVECTIAQKLVYCTTCLQYTDQESLSRHMSKHDVEWFELARLKVERIKLNSLALKRKATIDLERLQIDTKIAKLLQEDEDVKFAMNLQRQDDVKKVEYDAAVEEYEVEQLQNHKMDEEKDEDYATIVKELYIITRQSGFIIWQF